MIERKPKVVTRLAFVATNLHQAFDIDVIDGS
jgi:hypothetical protein